MNSIVHHKLSASVAIGNAWRIFKGRWGVIIMTIIASGIVNSLANNLPQYLSVVAGWIISYFVLKVLINIHDGKELKIDFTVNDIINFVVLCALFTVLAIAYFAIVTTLLYFVFMGAWLFDVASISLATMKETLTQLFILPYFPILALILIVPYLYVMLRLSYALSLIADKSMTMRDALYRSWAITKNNVAQQLLLGLYSLLLMLPFAILLFFVGSMMLYGALSSHVSLSMIVLAVLLALLSIPFIVMVISIMYMAGVNAYKQVIGESMSK